MAALAWKVYNRAKESIGDNTIDMDAAIFHIALFKSSSNCNNLSLTGYGSLTNEVNNGNGYVTTGMSLTNYTWAEGTSAKAIQFDSTAQVWTAASGSIASIQYAVIYQSGGAEDLLCFSSLSSGIFSVTDTNTLTITPHNGSGIFEMV